ncbi:MAG: dynamin family protein [Pseudomonadota bacterium]
MCAVQISESAYSAMQAWQGDKPVAALMGEFSAGKSTLLNFILGEDVAQINVKATHMPPIWITYAQTPFSIGLRHDGTEEEIDLSRGDINFRKTYLAIRVGRSLPALLKCDIIDAPGISDPNLPKDALRFLSRYMDFAIWCTAANQAWRQTERAAFKKLAKSTRDNSILVVTRVDKLRKDTDRAKVMKRITRDAGKLFSQIVALQTPKAAALSADDRTNDPDGAWVTTGGYDFETAFCEAISAIDVSDRTPAAQANASAQTPTTSQPTKTTKSASAPKISDGNSPIEPSPDRVAVEPVTTSLSNQKTTKETKMASTDITKLNDISGFIGACLVDTETGLMMASEGGDNFDLEAAGAANTEVVKAKMAAMKMLGIDEAIDDILITLGSQFHLIRPLADTPSVFLYTALDKKSANLGMARVQVKKVENTLEL